MITVTRQAGAGRHLAVGREEVARMAEAMLEAVDHGGADVEISLVDDAAIAVLNEEFLGCVGPTNVLSFPLDEGEGGEDGPMVFGEGFEDEEDGGGNVVRLDAFDPEDALPVDDILCDCSDEGVDESAFDYEGDPDALDEWDGDGDAGLGGEFGDDPEDGAFGGEGFEDGAWALGSLVVSLETVVREAALYGQDAHEHFARLLAHGLLHLTGLDHGDEMEMLTERALAAVL